MCFCSMEDVLLNKLRRNKIKSVIDTLERMEREIESIKDDEEFAFESMPEGLQSSERGQISEEAIDLLDEALDLIEQTITSLNNIG